MGHPAVFPVELPRFFIKLLTPEGGLVIDPFGGSGTTGVAAVKEKRKFILIDNNQEYCEFAQGRLLRDCNIEIPIVKEKNFKETKVRRASRPASLFKNY